MTKRLADFDEYQQGIPINRKMVDLETGRVHVVGATYVTREEFIQLQTELETKINQQIDILAKALIELQQIKLHVAALSGEHIDETDVEGA